VSFTYQATDLSGMTSNVATITVNVTGVNDTPTAQSLAVKATEDGAASKISFVADDVDTDDTPASLHYVLQGAPANVTNNNNGTFSFTPGKDFQELAAGETETLTFTYTAVDSHGLSSAPANVSVTVTGVNDAPTVAALAATVHEGAVSDPISFKGDDVDSD